MSNTLRIVLIIAGVILLIVLIYLAVRPVPVTSPPQSVAAPITNANTYGHDVRNATGLTLDQAAAPLQSATGTRVATAASCEAFGGPLTCLYNVTCEQARRVATASPPGTGQKNEPFQVPDLGTWKTLDDLKRADQQWYSRVDGGASFSYDLRE